MQSLPVSNALRPPFRRVLPALFAFCLCSPLITCAAGANGPGANPNTGQKASTSTPVMSDQSLRALQQANAYGASIFHVPAPGPNFIEQMRVAIPRDYAGMDQGMRLGLANIERDLPSLSGYFANKNPQQVASFVQDYHAKIMAPKDPVEQQVLLAEVISFIALTSYKQHQNGTSANNAFQQQQMQTLKYQQLQHAVRSYSPTCVPTSTDPTCR